MSCYQGFPQSVPMVLSHNQNEGSMYKVYLKIYNKQGLSEVDKDSRTTTPSPEAAGAAFRALLKRDDLAGQNVHAVLSLDRKQLMYHRFDRLPGDRDYVDPNAEIKLFHEKE